MKKSIFLPAFAHMDGWPAVCMAMVDWSSAVFLPLDQAHACLVTSVSPLFPADSLILGPMCTAIIVTLALFFYCYSREIFLCVFLSHRWEKKRWSFSLISLCFTYCHYLPVLLCLGPWCRPLCSLWCGNSSVNWDLNSWWIFKFLPNTSKGRSHKLIEVFKMCQSQNLLITNICKVGLYTMWLPPHGSESPLKEVMMRRRKILNT